MKKIELGDYNENVSALIAKMCLSAYDKFDKEKLQCQSDRVAMARAIGDTIKENMEVFEYGFGIDREVLNSGIGQDERYVEHLEMKTFNEFAEKIRQSENYRVIKYNNNYEVVHKYQFAVFKFPKL